MRSIKEHMQADEYLLGYSNPAVHSFLDSSVKFYGPAHRLDYHDYKTVKLLDNSWSKKDGDIALLHILLDLHILDDKLIMKTIKEKR